MKLIKFYVWTCAIVTVMAIGTLLVEKFGWWAAPINWFVGSVIGMAATSYLELLEQK